MSPQTEGQFRSSRNEQYKMILESDGVSVSDSAVWYCAASPHSIPV